MYLHHKAFVLSLLAFSVQHAMADQPTELATIQLHAQPKTLLNVNDKAIEHEQLMEGATTIGNALNGQAGVYGAQYTGGVSRPVIRGQDGARVKITENGGDVLDVSSVSPDHAVTVDPNSAQEVQLIQGADTLLYGAGSVGGLVNVVDNKIPNQMPKDGFEGHIGTRYNTGSDDMLYSADTTIGLGSQVALKVGGLTRRANDYILPNDLQQQTRREDSTFAKSDNYNAGLSWIYDRGFTGISFSNRHDRYGIPGDVDSEWEPDANMMLTVPADHEDDEDEAGGSGLILNRSVMTLKRN